MNLQTCSGRSLFFLENFHSLLYKSNFFEYNGLD